MRLFVLIFLGSCIHTSAQLSNITKAWQNDKDLSNSAIAFSVRNVKSKEILAQYNASQLLLPASTQKIFCTAAALARFGADYKFETKLCSNGTITAEGVLKGDLLIVGCGDPSLQSKYCYKEKLVEKWAAEIQKKGIKKIEGAVIGDAGAFEPSINGAWLYEDVSNYYGAGNCALNYADNKFSLFLESGTAGSSVTLSSIAPLYTFQNYSLTINVIASGTRDEAYVYGDPGSFKRTVKGSIPANKKSYEVEAALPDPALLCAEELFLALKKLGITATSGAKSNYNKGGHENLQVLYTHFSPPLAQLIKIANQQSNNQYTEALRYLIGLGDAAQGSLWIKSYCAKLQIDTAALFFEDACGLSRLNACSADAQCAFLAALAGTGTGQSFYESLAVAGVSGSLLNFGKGSALVNNLRAKSGSLTRARGYCGYLTTKTGQNLAFSILINNYACSGKALKPKFETFLKALYDL